MYYRNFFICCRVRAYGPGIEPNGVVVKTPTNFTVETFSAGKGDVDVIVEDVQGNKIPVRVILFNVKCFSAFKTHL